MQKTHENPVDYSGAYDLAIRQTNQSLPTEALRY